MMMDEIPEISVHELKQKMDRGDIFTLLDVRETWELDYARFSGDNVLVIPMSVMAQQRENVFPPELRNPEAPIVVMCHHGIRSANVVAWMLHMGWKNVVSLAGGIDAYALEIDPSVGKY